MSLLTFKGGVHPNDGKALAKDKAIVQVQPKGDLVYPMSQHIGAPAVPIVAKGDHVLRGQMIAEAGGFVSAPIYASVSGTVKVIEPRFTPAGSKVNSIVIENDGEYEEVEYSTPKAVSEMSKEEILNAIGDAGIVGMGGAGFPTKVKLSPKEPDKIDYIIANCAECEPYITADYRQILEHGEELVEGMKIILRLFDNAKGLFGVEDNKPDCIEKLKENGCRITKQRKMLIDIILENECSSCKEIFYKASQADEKIGVATVYRMINALEEIGAINRKNMYKVDCAQDCPEDGGCIIMLDDDTIFKLTETGWNKVIREGLKHCGYVKDQKVTSIKLPDNKR